VLIADRRRQRDCVLVGGASLLTHVATGYLDAGRQRQAPSLTPPAASQPTVRGEAQPDPAQAPAAPRPRVGTPVAGPSSAPWPRQAALSTNPRAGTDARHKRRFSALAQERVIAIERAAAAMLLRVSAK
jgi:hypothetical protein